MKENWTIWGVRALFGVLLLWGADVLLWADVATRPLGEWGLRLIGSMALSTALLDVAVRYRIRDSYDSLALMGGYGLLAGALLAPQFALIDLPRTLLTRVIGGYGLVGVEMFGVLIALTGGHFKRVRWLFIGAIAWNGFYWGVWMRWMPELGGLFEAVPFEQMMAFALVYLLPIVAIWGGLRLSPRFYLLTPLDLRLGRVGWAVVLFTGFSLLIWRGIEGTLTTSGLLAIVLLLGVSWAILWFRREARGKTLLDGHFPPHPLAWGWVFSGGSVFLLMAFFAYHLPLVGTPQINQLWLMEMGFGAVGALWYPLVASVIAFRGVDTQLRKNVL